MKQALQSKKIMAQIEKQRRHIESILHLIGPADILESIRTEIIEVHRLFKKYGISLMGRQLLDAQYRLCNSKTAEQKKVLALEREALVTQLLQTKKDMPPDLKEKEEIITQLYALLFASIHTGYLEKEYAILIDLIEQLATLDACMLYKGIDEIDAAGIVQTNSFFYNILILSLFSTVALLHAYAIKNITSNK